MPGEPGSSARLTPPRAEEFSAPLEDVRLEEGRGACCSKRYSPRSLTRKILLSSYASIIPVFS